MPTPVSKKYFFHKINRNYRLFVSLAIALIVWLLIRDHALPVAFMLTWIAFSGSFLIFSWVIILSSHPRGLRNIAAESDSSRTLIFLFVLFAAFISVFDIIVLLQEAPNDTKRGLTYH